MANSFQDVLIRRNELLHRKAIWKEMVDHLGKFLDTDAVKASIGIKTDGEGMVVPQQMIEAEIQEIRNGYMAEIDEALETINRSVVAEHGNDKSAKKAKGKKQGKVPRRQKAPTGPEEG